MEESCYTYQCKNRELNTTHIEKLLCNCFNLAVKAEECVFALAFTAKGELLGVFEVSHGTVGASFMNMREVMIRMFLVGACSFILAHNHPSGDVSPSKNDYTACQNAVSTARMMGLNCLDFIIVGSSVKEEYGFQYFSFMEKDLLNPST